MLVRVTVEDVCEVLAGLAPGTTVDVVVSSVIPSLGSGLVLAAFSGRVREFTPGASPAGQGYRLWMDTGTGEHDACVTLSPQLFTRASVSAGEVTPEALADAEGPVGTIDITWQHGVLRTTVQVHA